MPKKIFTALFLITVIFFPLFSFGQGGLVPCGNDTNNNGTLDPSEACNTCHAFQLLNNVITFIFLDLFLPATAVAFLIGGVLMLTAGGNETQVSRGRSVLWNSVIGLLIAFSSWVIINTILNTIATGEYSAMWYVFPGCESSLPGPSPIDTVTAN